MLAFLLLLYAMETGDPGPIVETCAFLPAGTPCPLPPPSPATCIVRNGVEICT